MPESEKSLDLKLHSPAGVEPIIFHWPLTSGSGAVSEAWHGGLPVPLVVAYSSSYSLFLSVTHTLVFSLRPAFHLPLIGYLLLAQSLFVLFVLVPSIAVICLS